MAKNRPIRRRLFAGIALLSGVALLSFEVFRPIPSTRGERWFWMSVGVLVIVLGAAELMRRSDAQD